jgi:hypothetical protein
LTTRLYCGVVGYGVALVHGAQRPICAGGGENVNKK